jgi:hypothetical protein
MRENNWKTPVYILGGALGLVAGLISAYLYARTADESNAGAPPGRIRTGEAFRISLAALSLLRQISELGIRKGS